MRGLYELASGNDHAAAMEIFGRIQSDQTTATSWFINHIYRAFLDLVNDNLAWLHDNGYLH